MSQHYTKGTVSVRKWCNTCRRETEHSVSDGRLGRCVEDHHPPNLEKPVEESNQGEMFR